MTAIASISCVRYKVKTGPNQYHWEHTCKDGTVMPSDTDPRGYVRLAQKQELFPKGRPISFEAPSRNLSEHHLREVSQSPFSTLTDQLIEENTCFPVTIFSWICMF